MPKLSVTQLSPCSSEQVKSGIKFRKTLLRGMRLWNSFQRKMEVELPLLPNSEGKTNK